MKADTPKYGDVLVEEGKATLPFHVFLEEISDADGGAIESQDEGSTLTTATTVYNFVGSGVIATEALGVVTVTVAGAGTTNWGDITGTLANQTDLQSALDAKAVSGHTHTTNNITSGTFLDARIAETNVTQHQGALSIGIDQLTATANVGDNLIYDGANWVVDMTQLIKEVDFDGDYIYIGEAQPGTTTATASWRVRRTEFTGDDSETLYADGDADFNNTWTGRAGFSYS